MRRSRCTRPNESTNGVPTAPPYAHDPGAASGESVRGGDLVEGDDRQEVALGHALAVGDHGQGVGRGHGAEVVAALAADGGDAEGTVPVGGHDPDEVGLAVGAPSEGGVGDGPDPGAVEVG